MKNLIGKLKDFYDDKYGVVIIVSWIALALCCMIKIFGGNWFELWWDNPNFIAFCEYVDNTIWLKMIIACLIYLITTFPVVCILLNKEKIKTKIILMFLPLMITKSIISWYNLTICYILDIFIIILLPMILCKFRNWKRVILGNLLIFMFQLITIVMRNVSFDFNANTLIEQTLIQVDYYLMILLFYLYYFKNNKKETEV